VAIKARVKFRGDIPWELEHKLISRFNFRVSERCSNDFVVMEKPNSAKPKLEVLVNGKLPMHIQEELVRRCHTIVNHFTDPESHLAVIKIRLHNIGLTLPPIQRKFVEDWATANLKEDQ
jgi:hypothetical protein